MAGGKFAAADERLHRFRKLEQAQHVGDVATALADDPSDLVLAVFELPTERLITCGFFERIEVFALDVLDDRQFQRFGVADIEDDDGNVVDAGALRGPPTALAGNDLESAGGAGRRPHRDRLDDAALLDRGGEFVEFGHRELTARVARIGMQEFDGYAALAARALGILVGLGAHVAHQGCQAATQSRARGLVRHCRFSRKVVHAHTSPGPVAQSVIHSHRIVMAGLVPAIPMMEVPPIQLGSPGQTRPDGWGASDLTMLQIAKFCRLSSRDDLSIGARAG